MANKTLEERVTELERQLAELRTGIGNRGQVKDWRRTVGMFSGDVIMKQIDEEARKYRERDRRKAMKKRVAKRKTKA